MSIKTFISRSFFFESRPNDDGTATLSVRNNHEDKPLTDIVIELIEPKTVTADETTFSFERLEPGESVDLTTIRRDESDKALFERNSIKAKCVGSVDGDADHETLSIALDLED